MLPWAVFFLLLLSWVDANDVEPFANFSTVQQLNAYLEQFFAQNSSITGMQWYRNLPTNIERVQMKELLKRLHRHSETSFCNSIIMDDYKDLKKSCTITLFKDVYCVVHERGKSRRYWGYAVITHRNAVKRNLYHSAAHFQSDGDVCNQTAAIFERTKSAALVINGANRYAIKDNVTNQCQPKTLLADAAHNNETMFQTFNEALFEASADSENVVFIQWHGMAEASCSSLDAFISAGLQYSAPVYQNPASPVKKLKKYLNEMGYEADTPHIQSSCSFLGRTNVFGRYVNGVPAANVCHQFANETEARGMFVHIEQKRRVRDDWDLWTSAINTTFKEVSNDASPLGVVLTALMSTLNVNSRFTCNLLS